MVGGNWQLPLKGGHHDRSWTFKIDPKQVTIFILPTLNKSWSVIFSYPRQVFQFQNCFFSKFCLFRGDFDMLIDVHRCISPNRVNQPFFTRFLERAWCQPFNGNGPCGIQLKMHTYQLFAIKNSFNPTNLRVQPFTHSYTIIIADII